LWYALLAYYGAVKIVRSGGFKGWGLELGKKELLNMRKAQQHDILLVVLFHVLAKEVIEPGCRLT